jgi:hypothetical protein
MLPMIVDCQDQTQYTQGDSPFISLSEPFIEPSSIVSWLTISIPEILSQYVSRTSAKLVLHNKYK